MSGPEKIRPYEFHGLVFNANGKEWRADCPFCDKENHFFVNEGTGQFNCRRCDERGNIYTFLQKVHEISEKQTSLKELTKVANERGIPASELKLAGFCKSFIDDNWIMPAYNQKKSLANLYKVVKDDSGKWRPYGTPGCNMTPFGTLTVNKNTKTIWVCEGPWDMMMLRFMLRHLKTLKENSMYEPADLADILRTDKGDFPLVETHAVIAVPGASTFSPDWCEYFKDRQVHLVYDNDHPKKTPAGKVIRPGWDGMKRVVKLVAESNVVPKTFHRIRWGAKGHDPALPSGYDVRDIIRQKNHEGVKDLLRLLEPVDISNVGIMEEGVTLDPIDRATFAELCKDFAKSLHFSQMMQDCLAVSLAVVFSTTVKGDAQLWIRIIGPPGCLTADSQVEINRNGLSKKISIHKLYQCLTHGAYPGCRPWDLSIPTYIRGRDADGYIRLFRVKRAVYSGIKEVFCITTKEGHKLKATADHRFLTENGWKRLGDICVGDRVYVDGGLVSSGEHEQKKHYAQVEGLRYHPHAGRIAAKRFSVCKHRLIVEAYNNGIPYEDYIDCLRNGNTKDFVYLSPEEIVHHKDGNHKNNTLNNLEVISSLKEHSELHGIEGAWKYVTSQTTLATVKKIVSKKEDHTYDIEVADANHNFLANGFVVHNSGKSTIAECISADKEHTYPQSIITGFHSGHASGGSKDKKGKRNASLIPKMLDKTVVMKDADTLCSSPNRDQILSELRDIYDGVSRSTYRNGISGNFENIQATFILCGTDELRTLNRSALGDRFLDCEILEAGNNHRPFLQSAFRNTFSSAANSFVKEESGAETHGEKMLILKRATMGFIRHLKSQIGVAELPTYAPEDEEQVMALGQFISYMRARVKREKNDLLYRPRAELATRLTAQLARLAIGLTIVLGKKSLDKEVLRILRKIAWDTATGFPREIVDLMIKHANGLSTRQIAIELQLPESSIKKHLFDMQELKIVQKRATPNRSGIRGRDLHLWELLPEIADLYKIARGPRSSPKPKKVK